jgi:hypothetical protein
MTYTGVVAAASSAITRIAQVALVANAASIDFTSIPQTYATLLVVGSITTGGSGGEDLRLRFNGTATGYDNLSSRLASSQGAAVTTTAAAGATYGVCGVVGAGSRVSVVTISIPSYANANTWRSWEARAAFMGSGSSNWWNTTHAGALQNAGTAVTSIALTTPAGNFWADSKVTLYGLS